MYRGVATFTLDYGKCPPYLFSRMVKLGREMIRVMVLEYGPDEFIKRIADPVWFQSLGTVLAFDWNASGLTTILTAALKEAIEGEELDLGIFICGGKGKTSRKTPDQIMYWSERLNLPSDAAQDLVYDSRMSAKVDSALVQDGYQIYHHAFFFSKHGAWTVVQQGMNTLTTSARRYHWHDHLRKTQNFVNEPHTGIASQQVQKEVLNLTAADSNKTRDISTELVQAGYKQVKQDIELLRKHATEFSRVLSLRAGENTYTALKLARTEFEHHPVELEDLSRSKYLDKILYQVAEQKPKSYQELLSYHGVGAKTIRALALVSEVIYGAKPSYEDPARYSFAHGGKDATPYPVDTETYDHTIATVKELVLKTKLSQTEKDQAIRRLV